MTPRYSIPHDTSIVTGHGNPVSIASGVGVAVRGLPSRSDDSWKRRVEEVVGLPFAFELDVA